MRKINAFLFGTFASIGSAMAELPADVTTAIGTAKTDGVQLAGLVLAAIIAIYAFKLVRRSL